MAAKAIMIWETREVFVAVLPLIRLACMQKKKGTNVVMRAIRKDLIFRSGRYVMTKRNIPVATHESLGMEVAWAGVAGPQKKRF